MQINLQSECYHQEQVATVDAEVEALGGCKRLLIARYFAGRMQNSAEQSRGVQEVPEALESAACCFRERLLSEGVIMTLVRLQGHICIWVWGIHCKSTRASTSSVFLHMHSFLGESLLQPLHSVDSHALVERIKQRATFGGLMDSRSSPAGPPSI